MSLSKGEPLYVDYDERYYFQTVVKQVTRLQCMVQYLGAYLQESFSLGGNSESCTRNLWFITTMQVACPIV